MIFVVIAALLFLFAGKTGKLVRLTLARLILGAVVYFGIPIYGAVLYWYTM